MKGWIIFAGWLLCGVLGIIIGSVPDLRGKKYDAEYIDEYRVVACFCGLIGGPFTLFVGLVYYFIMFFLYNQFLTKILYNIANIGIKKKEDKDGAATD